MLAKKKVVTRLMDLMCKYNPNTLVYVQANPPLEKLVLTVSFIVRSIPCILDPIDLNDAVNNGVLDPENPLPAMLSMMEARG